MYQAHQIWQKFHWRCQVAFQRPWMGQMPSLPPSAMAVVVTLVRGATAYQVNHNRCVADVEALNIESK
jgi:hypothetical protein